MNYPQLPLINVYPISESQPSPWQVVIAKCSGESIPRVEIANTPLEFAEITARKIYVNKLQTALENALRVSEEYKKCISLMQPLANVPSIQKYRTRYPHFDSDGVDHEIKLYGGLLHPGQVLFHGGVWPGSNEGNIFGQKITLTKPLSTTLCAGVAGAHSNSHNPKQIWVITVSSLICTPAYLFSNKGNQPLADEREVLFSSGAIIECIAGRQLEHYQILEVLIT